MVFLDLVWRLLWLPRRIIQHQDPPPVFSRMNMAAVHSLEISTCILCDTSFKRISNKCSSVLAHLNSFICRIKSVVRGSSLGLASSNNIGFQAVASEKTNPVLPCTQVLPCSHLKKSESVWKIEPKIWMDRRWKHPYSCKILGWTKISTRRNKKEKLMI
jgi:hypothetical protein